MIKLQMMIERYDLKARNHAAIMRQLNMEGAERQRVERLPQHFTSEGYNLYGYESRTTAYNKRKQKKYGHQLPNVYSGDMRNAVFRNVKLTATPTKWLLKTRGAKRKKLGQKTDSRLWAARRREIESMAQSEIDLERERQARGYRRMATSAKYSRKRKRKAG